MKRLFYIVSIVLFFCSCEKSEDNFSIVGDWNLYGVKLYEVVIDTAASSSELSALKSIVNAVHAGEDSTAFARNIIMTFTSDYKYFQNGEELGSYSFTNNTLTIQQGEQTISYDSVFLNKSFLSYIVDRTPLFTDSVFLHDNGLADTISTNLIHKVRSRYSYKKP